MVETTAWFWLVKIVANNRNNGVRNGKQATLAVERLAGVRARIGLARLTNSKHTATVLVCGHATWLLAHMAPVQAPVNVWRRKAGRFALDANRAAHHYGQVANWTAHNSWLLASNLITLVCAIVLIIAHKSLENALIAVSTQELIRLANLIRSSLSTRALILIGIIHTIILTVAEPHFLYALAISALFLIRLASSSIA